MILAQRRKAVHLPSTWPLTIAGLLILATGLLGATATHAAFRVLRFLHSGIDYHPDTTHSFFLSGYQSLICCRNTGLYVGTLLTMAWAIATGRGRTQGFPTKRVGVALGFLFFLMAADGFNSLSRDTHQFYLYTPHNLLRLGTGLLAGIAVGAYFLPVINSLVWRQPDNEPIVPGFRSLGSVLLWQLPLWLVVALRVNALALPVAVLTSLATFVLFGAINLIVVLMVTRRDGQFTRLGQLILPVAASLGLTLVQLVLMAWLVHSLLLPTLPG